MKLIKVQCKDEGDYIVYESSTNEPTKEVDRFNTLEEAEKEATKLNSEKTEKDQNVRCHYWTAKEISMNENIKESLDLPEGRPLAIGELK